MSLPMIPTAVACLILAFAVYRFLIFPAFVSPLAKIPLAHPIASVSPLWILWKRHQFKENSTLYAAHQALGPFVRIAPNEISVNCVDGGIRTIYAGGYEKDPWYHLFDNYDNVPNMFSTAGSKPHSSRKRMISNVYSKSFLQSSPTMSATSRAIIHDRLIPKISALGSQPLEAHLLFNSITMDLVTAYQFGLCNGSNFIQDEAEAKWWLGLYQSRKKFTFWPQELPGFTAWMSRMGINLVPSFVGPANKALENWCLSMVDAAAAASPAESHQPENDPVVYQQLANALHKEDSKQSLSSSPLCNPLVPHRLQIASELIDNFAAGHETSAITLTYLFHELSSRPDLQRQIHDELRANDALIAVRSGQDGPQDLPGPKVLDGLPLLQAVLQETLRLHAAIPGPQPRSTPANATLGPYTGLPAGVRVAASAHCLHRIPSVFSSPLEWQPERWRSNGDQHDSERLAEMNRHFWAFGSGGRMCIGSNLAIQQMKLIISAIVSNWMVECIDDEGIEQEDSYTAQPHGQKLVLRFHKWNEAAATIRPAGH